MPSDYDLFLIDAWTGVVDSIIGIAASTPVESWREPSRLAGWSVADIVAHVVDVESLIAGDPRPEHVPDWESLPHVDEDIARFTEVGVDARRGMSQAEVVDSLRDLRDRRRAQLLATPEGQDVLSASGKAQPMSRLLSMRCFDLWVHDDDLRAARSLAPDEDSPAFDMALSAGLALAETSWQGQDPPQGDLTIGILEPDGSVIDFEMGGTGEVIRLTGTRHGVLTAIAGRHSGLDAHWAGLIVAP